MQGRSTEQQKPAGLGMPFIMVFVGGHNYIFYCTPGKEKALLCAMIDLANDPEHPFGWPELHAIVRHDLLKIRPKEDGEGGQRC